jgi:uncharacterized membrane protein YfcA
MNYSVIIGYLIAILMGVALGLFGGGGSILTVPLMVYLLGVQPLSAVCYSLFVVGNTSLIGAVQNYRNGNLQLRTTFLFGSTSVVTVFLLRKLIVPAIPEVVISTREITITYSQLTMIVFGILMIASSIIMIRRRHLEVTTALKSKSKELILAGFFLGCLTGLLGAGGGFLIIPALVLYLGLPMKKAVGTSLLIIAMNSLVGFVA